VEFHDGVERIGEWAFCGCPLLSQIKLPGVRLIIAGAFRSCTGLEDVEFGDRLETIGFQAFFNCISLRSITIPSIRTIGEGAFYNCTALTDAEFGKKLAKFLVAAFERCSSLRRISIPLRDNMFIFSELYQGYNQFYSCHKLATVDLVGGGIHKTVTSLHLESWRDDMNEEIQLINRVLPVTGPREKADEIRRWIQSVIRKIEYYKAEHNMLLKEATTLLELALWKAKLDEEDEGGSLDEIKTKKIKIDIESARKEARITSGASIVIKNVLPFLKLG